MKTESRLEKVLSAGHFAVTAECGPPKGADVAVLEEKGKYLLNRVDAVNVTDNQTAIVRMSSIAACAILKGLGHEPILQMVTRDRNRIALQSDLFGAYALGIRNVLMPYGRPPLLREPERGCGGFRSRFHPALEDGPGYAG